jgi:Nucleotidyltransferase domain/Domain of unknown function (DUF4037)
VPPRIEELVQRLARVRGVRAVVLGGSRARGTHTDSSDHDLGLYYAADDPIDVAQLNALIASVDDTHRSGLATAIGGWGEWINGGAWLKVDGQQVDLLYRDLGRVEAVIRACLKGCIKVAYQPGHPHAFVSSFYLAEVALCRVLADRSGEIAALRVLVMPYPGALRHALIRRFTWEARFALDNAARAVNRRDVAYVAGCGFRCVACMLQVAFAINREHWMNEKGALAMAERFAVGPPQMRARIEQALGELQADAGALQRCVSALGAVCGELEALADAALAGFTPVAGVAAGFTPPRP